MSGREGERERGVCERARTQREGGERECVRSEWKGGERERGGVCEK